MAKGKYILIVEDSPTQAKQIEAVLKKLAYPISIAGNANEALGMIKEQKPVIVIADIIMPEMDGFQLCKTIKCHEQMRDIPVVLLTQLSDPKEIIRGLESGADNFIVKPYSEALLLARMQTLISMRLETEAQRKEIKILIAEDSPTQAEQLRHLLEEHEYTVLVAYNGREALETARKIRPTVIISDILMPEMDGYELAQEIKQDPELKNIPIIFVTSLMDKKEASRKAKVIADGYFTKPYDESYLISKVENLLGSQTHEDAADAEGIDVTFGGDHYTIASGRRQILNFLLSIYENAVQQNRDLVLMQQELRSLNDSLEERVWERTQQLRESEENFKAIVVNANDGISVITGTDGKIAYANKALADISGYSMEEMFSMRISDAVAAEDLLRVMENYKLRLQGLSAPLTYGMHIIRKDGQKIPIEVTSAKVSWHGESASMAIIRDISERKKMEEELLKASKLESLSTLAGGIAHDFNNLLMGILGNVTLAKMLCKPGDKTYEILSNLEKASERSKDLTQQLLTFARGGAPLKKTVLIAQLLKDSAAFAVRGSNAKCDFSIADSLWPAAVDEGQISQAIQNLVINADQAMPNGGTITVSAQNITIGDEDKLPLIHGRYILVTVKDTGAGIPQEHLQKIFDPYFTTKETGSGLGLASVYSIIKNHDGHIVVESETGRGTIFSIYLPASEEISAVEEKAEMQPVTGSGRILVMDDEVIVRDVVCTILTELGYEVSLAKNGSEAIDAYKNAKNSGKPFDAVIMDLTIPGGMGGAEAIKKLLEIDPHARTIVSSGYSDVAIMSDYREHGFKAVIAKPYKVAELSRTVHSVINPKP